MEMKEYLTYCEEEILDLYESVGWTAYTEQPEVLKKGFVGSLLILAVYHDGQLVGLIRTVGDGHTIVFVQDLLVRPEFQRQGIGSRMLKEIIERFSHVRQIELVTDDAPNTVAFYRSAGMIPLREIGCCGWMGVPKG